MSLKKILLICVITTMTSLSFGQGGKKSYPEADAVYLSLTKTYVLNKDGSMVNSVEKRQKLLTHRAFQSLFGETRITFNPQFQNVVVRKAFTENNQHEKIETPQNGYNNILPGFYNTTKAFSHLREMVVTHTGLERGAVINCNYDIQTAAGKLPGLMGDEELQADCPIEKLTIQVKVPTGILLHFKLLNTKIIPKIEKGKEFDTYTWQLNDVPQRNREIHTTVCNDLPKLLFSTLTDDQSTIKWLTSQDAFRLPAGEEIKKYVDQKISEVNSPLLKALKIQEIVVKELSMTPIPAQLLAYQVRTSGQVWQSNAGTTLERNCLLSAILRAEGLNADVCLIVPSCYVEEGLPFLLVAEPVVKITTDQEGVVLLSADRLNAGNFDMCNNQQLILPLGTDNKKLNISNPGDKIEVMGALVLTADGVLKGEIQGTFSNRYNPFYEISRNAGETNKLISGLPGKAEKSTPAQSNLKFSIEKKDAFTTRGNIKFAELIESEAGISSLHLKPLPLNRTSTLDLGAPVSESYRYTYTVPEGYQLANPIDVTLAKPSLGKLTLRIQQHDNIIEVMREFEITKSIIPKEEYADFRELIDRWFTSKYRQLILKTD